MIILGTNSIKDTGYDVANSLRFNDGSSDNLSGTLSSGSGSDVKGTISLWVKRSHLGTNQAIICGKKANTERVTIGFSSENRFEIQFQDTSNAYNWRTNALYRDISAWYSCIIKLDTANGTATSRARVWINNEEITSWNIQETVPQNLKIGFFNNTNTRLVGARGGSSTDKFFDGYIAEVVGINNALSDNTDFIEVDEDSGIIKPIDVSGLTFGTNGFYLDFEDSSALGNDVSGNDNDFTVNNLTAIDQSTDTCTNNFATLNPLMNNLNNLPTLSEGNLEVLAVSGSTWSVTPSTIGLPKSGKWYYEVEAVSGTSGDRAAFAGWINPTVSDPLNNGSLLWRNTASSNSILSNNSPATGSFSATTWGTNGNIIGMYIDMDNSKLYFAHNGTIQNSGTGIDFQGTFDDDTFILPVVMVINTEKLSVNFGNPAANFAIASGNTDVNGFGNFEFDPSAGTFDGASKDFLAICTKNLAEYG